MQGFLLNGPHAPGDLVGLVCTATAGMLNRARGKSSREHPHIVFTGLEQSFALFGEQLFSFFETVLKFLPDPGKIESLVVEYQ